MVTHVKYLLVLLPLICLHLHLVDAIGWTGILIASGYDDQSTVQILTTTGVTSNTSLNFNIPARTLASAVKFNHNVIYLGGRSGQGTIHKSMTIFNPQSNLSVSGEDMLQNREGFGATVLGDVIIICGGATNGFQLLSSYNKGRWIKIISIPSSPAFTGINGVGLVTIGDAVYAIGGRLANVCMFRMGIKSWSVRAKMPEDMNGVAVIPTKNGTMALVCGAFGSRKCFIYDPVKNLFSTFHSLNKATPTSGRLNLVQYQGRIYAMGRQTIGLGGSKVVQVLDETSGWQVLPWELTFPIAEATAVAI